MIRRTVGKVVRKFGSGCYRLSSAIDPVTVAPELTDPKQQAHMERLAAWYAIDGDQTLRMNIDLPPDAVVFDLGGYDGSVAVEVQARFGCTVHIFEPCLRFFQPLQKRLHRNPKFVLYPFGLAAHTRTEQIAINAAGTSIFRIGEQTEPIELKCAADFFAQHHFPKVDFLKVNIEGGEFELLDHLLATDLITRMHCIQIQFHEDVLPDSDSRMRRIQEQLRQTHHLDWQHEWIWEQWSLIKN